MSYTLNYTGSEIDDILDRAAPGGALDTAIAAKQDALTFDAVPTEGSTNPAESGGIYDAIQAGGAAALAAFATDTVSGDVVSFPDGADGIPVKAFTGSILPQQNLNGQSAPYPAGGGKNKLPLPAAAAAVGVTLTVNTDGSITLTGTATSAVTFDFFAAGTFDSTAFAGYIFSAGANWAGSTSGYSVRVMSGSTAAQVITANETAIVDNGSGLRLMLRVGSGTAFPSGGLKLYPMLRASGTDNTFAPYSNICPISGWTGARLFDTGVNVWSEEWEQGAYNSSTGEKVVNSYAIRAKNLIPVKPNTDYFIKVPTVGARIFWYDINGAFISTELANNVVKTSPSAAHFLTFNVGNQSNPITSYANNISINYPSTDTDYHAYNGSAILLDFGQTVYAGTLTALGGGLWKVQPTHEIVTYDGSADEGWTLEASGRCYIENDALAKLDDYSTAILCDKLKTVERNGVMSSTDYCISGYKDSGGSYPTRNWIYAKADDTITSANAFKTWLAANPITVLYPLTDASKPDPITITGEDLQTLLGANTVWLDCGSVTGMTYRADTALYIDKKLGA